MDGARARCSQPVTWSEGFRRDASAIEPDYARLDSMLDGAEWILARTDLRGTVLVALSFRAAVPVVLRFKAKVSDDGGDALVSIAAEGS